MGTDATVSSNSSSVSSTLLDQPRAAQQIAVTAGSPRLQPALTALDAGKSRLLPASRGSKSIVAMAGLLLLAGGLGFALRITDPIEKDGQVTAIDVPPGSTPRTATEGRADVELPGQPRTAPAAALADASVPEKKPTQGTPRAEEAPDEDAPDNADDPAAQKNFGVRLWIKGEEASHQHPPDLAKAEELRRRAIEHWRTALRIRPTFADALNNLGCALRHGEAREDDAARQKRLEEAVTCFEMAIDARPEHADAQSNLALTLWELKRPEAAVEHFKRARSLQPDHVDALAAYSLVLFQMAEAAQTNGKTTEAAAASSGGGRSFTASDPVGWEESSGVRPARPGSASTGEE